MSFKSFLISKSFFKQIAIMSVVGVIMIFAIIKSLDIYTNNGEFILVPYLENRDADSLLVLSSSDYLQYIITDSIYADDRMPGTVVGQHPEPDSKVKQGRKIYLSIVAKTPEMVAMPNLIDLSIRRAVDLVQHTHLKIKNLKFENDIALNAVIGQKIDTTSIPPDSLLSSGSKITLIVGNGYKTNGAAIPFLVGKNAHDAKNLILKSSFNIGRIDTLAGVDEGELRVCTQSPFTDPMHPQTAKLGSKMSIVLKSTFECNFDSLQEYYNSPDSIRYDSLNINMQNSDF
jgi:beta-lactam-binding protein with PASTA domain